MLLMLAKGECDITIR